MLAVANIVHSFFIVILALRCRRHPASWGDEGEIAIAIGAAVGEEFTIHDSRSTIHGSSSFLLDKVLEACYYDCAK